MLPVITAINNRTVMMKGLTNGTEVLRESLNYKFAGGSADCISIALLAQQRGLERVMLSLSVYIFLRKKYVWFCCKTLSRNSLKSI